MNKEEMASKDLILFEELNQIAKDIKDKQNNIKVSLKTNFLDIGNLLYKAKGKCKTGLKVHFNKWVKLVGV